VLTVAQHGQNPAYLDHPPTGDSVLGNAATLNVRFLSKLLPL